MVETIFNMMFGIIGYIYFWWWFSCMVNLSYSFFDLFTLLFKVPYFICGVNGWLTWLFDGWVNVDEVFIALSSVFMCTRVFLCLYSESV